MRVTNRGCFRAGFLALLILARAFPENVADLLALNFAIACLLAAINMVIVQVG